MPLAIASARHMLALRYSSNAMEASVSPSTMVRVRMVASPPEVGFWPAVGETTRTVLFDAQTSGGLLIAVDPANEATLVEDLRRRGTPASSVIGRTLAGEPGRISVRPS